MKMKTLPSDANPTRGDHAEGWSGHKGHTGCLSEPSDATCYYSINEGSQGPSKCRLRKKSEIDRPFSCLVCGKKYGALYF